MLPMDNIERLIDNYKPAAEVADLVLSMKIVSLVGISGAGKDAIKNQLLKKSDDYAGIVTCTTRKPRIDDGELEVEGVNYYFINYEKVAELLASREYVEVSLVHGKINGSTTAELRRIRRLDKIAVADVDVQGLRKYKSLSQAVVAIFISPPDYTSWRKRLSSRYATKKDFEIAWPRRRDDAISELSQALAAPYYHFVANDDINRAVKAVDEIARKSGVAYGEDDEARLRANELLKAIKESS